MDGVIFMFLLLQQMRSHNKQQRGRLRDHRMGRKCGIAELLTWDYMHTRAVYFGFENNRKAYHTLVSLILHIKSTQKMVSFANTCFIQTYQGSNFHANVRPNSICANFRTYLVENSHCIGNYNENKLSVFNNFAMNFLVTDNFYSCTQVYGC